MATQKKQIEAVARAAKRRGIPLSECGLMKPWAREIFEAEYKRFQPRKPYRVGQIDDDSFYDISAGGES